MSNTTVVNATAEALRYINCTAISDACPVQATVYGYYPSLAANGAFLGFFVLFFFLNIALGVWYKTWTYTIGVACGCLTEAIGYAGRIIMHHNPWSNGGFIAQIVTLIIGPAFNSASIYLTLKYITLLFGAESSRIKPEMYTWIFICGDMISLVLQAVGGAMESTAKGNLNKLHMGDDFTMAGISWQVFTLTLFAVVVVDYYMRRSKSGVPLSPHASKTLNSFKFQFFAVGVFVAWLTIYIRCVYRIAEFAGGWKNGIMQNQVYFIVLDGVMVVTAVLAQTLPHPGHCFPALSSRKREEFFTEPKILSASSSEQSLAGRYNVTQNKGGR